MIPKLIEALIEKSISEKKVKKEFNFNKIKLYRKNVEIWYDI